MTVVQTQWGYSKYILTDTGNPKLEIYNNDAGTAVTLHLPAGFVEDFVDKMRSAKKRRTKKPASMR